MRVDDPRGNGTKLGYFPASAGNLLKWRAEQVTDRNDKDTDVQLHRPRRHAPARSSRTS